MTAAGFGIRSHATGAARTLAEVEARRAMIERIGRLSDSLIAWGPFGIGLDGILAWVPGLGELYSAVAGGLLVYEGWRARVPTAVLLQVGGIIALRTAIDFGNVIPIAGVGSSLIVDLFRGHRWAARILTKAIDETLYLEGAPDPASAAYRQAQAQIRRGGKRRIVSLG
jgi:hypothetical protein